MSGSIYRDAVLVSEDYQDMMFYHGVADEDVAQKILQDGVLRPGRRWNDPGTEEDDATIAPMLGRVYMSTKLEYVLSYVLGADRSLGLDVLYQYGGRYGYLFTVPGTVLLDIMPDEDTVGEMLADGHWLKEFYDIVDRNSREFEPINRRLAEEEWDRMVEEGDDESWTVDEFIDHGYDFFSMLKSELYPEVAIAGKFFLNHINDEDIEVILEDMPAAISNAGPVRFSECWRFDKQRTNELSEDVSNFFKIAERCDR